MHNDSTLATAVNIEGHYVPDKYYRQKTLPGVICQQGSYSMNFLQQQVIIMAVVQVVDKTRTKCVSFTILSSVIVVLSMYFHSSVYLSFFILIINPF